MKVSRTSRLNGEYQKEISAILRKVKDRNPELKGLVSVTEVDVAPDLKTAYVYVSIYGVGEAELKRSFEILQNNAGFIRRELAQVMRMRTVPALTFRTDGSMSYGAKMDELFKGLTYSTPEETDGKED
ncbi:MAG: 30S ribosome-binding factor RbfA [Clostridia bacterium]|nr:30S ribosome-binding factor RbfA [Clostridia bacterium]